MALLSSLPVLFARLRNLTSLKFLGTTALAFVLAFSLFAQDAQAKRMGGGRSFGRQSHSIQQQHRGAMPPGQNQHASQRNQNASPQTPPAQPRNRWLGPLAGLAAGLGIAALLSHLGLGGALGGMLSNLLVIGLVVLAVYWIIRLFKSRKSNADAQNARGGQEPAFTSYKPAFTAGQPAEPFTPAPAATVETAAATTIDMQPPAAHSDNEAFLRAAKVQFIRLQAAWDTGDLNDIRKFTTAEMFAEIKLDVTERGTTPSHTDVEQLNAELLSMENEGVEPLASVRFSGLIRETEEQVKAETFVEVWNFTKDETSNSEWKLAGIQQLD